MRIIRLVLLSTLGLVVPSALAVDATSDPVTVAQLRLAATNLDRERILTPDDPAWVYDFTKDAKYTWTPGGVVNADTATWPAVVGHKQAMSMLLLGPCAMLSPHYHPRADNFVVCTEGKVQTWMLNENGGRVVTTTLTKGRVTIFPKASVHTMQNMGELPLIQWPPWPW